MEGKMQTTTNYGFKKPQSTDPVLVKDFSDNWDSNDSKLKQLFDHAANTGVHVTVTNKNSWNAKADLTSPNFVGSPTAPTQVVTDNSNKIATTAFVKTAINPPAQITWYMLGGGHLSIESYPDYSLSGSTVFLRGSFFISNSQWFSGMILASLPSGITPSTNRTLNAVGDTSDSSATLLVSSSGCIYLQSFSNIYDEIHVDGLVYSK